MAAKVTTIIAAYNAERTIAQAVDSALEQKYYGNEVVVVDDRSHDSTLQILKRYGDHIWIIALSENGGPARARNVGVSASTGKYIAFLDSDDAWLPGKLTTLAAALERNSGASLAFSDYVNVGKDGVECGGSALGHAPSMTEMLKIRPPIIPSTWVLPRASFQRAGGFCELFKGAGLEDSWLLIVLREIGDFEFIPQRLALYRTDDSGKIADKYGRGLPTFIELVTERYGREGGKELVRNAKNLQCRWLL
jgi:glycosyltransferase involved in cell wall biosynthesis